MDLEPEPFDVCLLEPLDALRMLHDLACTFRISDRVIAGDDAILVWTADPVLRRRRLGRRKKKLEIASPIGRHRWLLRQFP